MNESTTEKENKLFLFESPTTGWTILDAVASSFTPRTKYYLMYNEKFDKENLNENHTQHSLFVSVWVTDNAVKYLDIYVCCNTIDSNNLKLIKELQITIDEAHDYATQKLKDNLLAKLIKINNGELDA